MLTIMQNFTFTPMDWVIFGLGLLAVIIYTTISIINIKKEKKGKINKDDNDVIDVEE